MKLIVGLGNPGSKFKNNRHNIGFTILDLFAMANGLSWKINRDLMCYFVKTNEFILVKPTTFMNESGAAVRAICDFYDVAEDDVLIVYDELDLDFGKIRLSFNGSSAGHKGIKSVIKSLASGDFARLRVGIGHPKDEGSGLAPKDYVLEDFSQEQLKELPEIIDKCEQAIRSFVDEGISATMNRFN